MSDLATVKQFQRPTVPVPAAFEPFPTHALPAVAADYVTEGAKAIGCDPTFIALPLLASLAAAIGNTRRIELKRGWAEPAILWTVVIGESGTHKTPAQRLALQAVRQKQNDAMVWLEQQRELYAHDMDEYEAQLSAWRKSKHSEKPVKPAEPVADRFWCSDVTVEALAALLVDAPRGLLVACDELAGWLGSFDAYKQARSDVARWLEMYAGQPLLVDRKTGDRKTLHVPRAAVSLTGGIQPYALRMLLGPAYFDNGLVARLLLAMPPRRPRLWKDAELDPAIELRLLAAFDRLWALPLAQDASGQPCPVDLPLTEPARRAWIAFYNDHAAEQATLPPELAAAWSKLEGAAARFALIVELVAWASGDEPEPSAVDVASVAVGIELSQWFGREARRVYGSLAEDDDQRQLRELVEFIRQSGGTVTPRAIMRAGPCFQTADEAKTALEYLADLGWGELQSAVSESGGRPSLRFTLAGATDTDKTPAGVMETGVLSMSERAAAG